MNNYFDELRENKIGLGVVEDSVARPLQKASSPPQRSLSWSQKVACLISHPPSGWKPVDKVHRVTCLEGPSANWKCGCGFRFNASRVDLVFVENAEEALKVATPCTKGCWNRPIKHKK